MTKDPTMTLSPRRTLIGAALLLAACEDRPARLPTGTALPPPRDVAPDSGGTARAVAPPPPPPAARFEPAPTPSQPPETTAERRARALQTQPTPGPGGFPGFGAPPGIGADQQLAPIPANRMR